MQFGPKNSSLFDPAARDRYRDYHLQ
jgi:hypothetical protein